MNRQKTLELARQADPASITKVAQVLALIDKIAPDYAPMVHEEVTYILDYTTEKLATPGELAKNLAHGAGVLGVGVASAAAAGLGLAIATDLFDAAKRGISASSNWRRIMQANPNIKDEVKDPEELKRAFNTVHRFAPEFTADPILGGAILVQIANLPPANRVARIGELLNSRKSLVDAKTKSFPIQAGMGLAKDMRGRDVEPTDEYLRMTGHRTKSQGRGKGP